MIDDTGNDNLDVKGINAEIARLEAIAELDAFNASDLSKQETALSVLEPKSEEKSEVKAARIYTEVEKEQMDKGWDPERSGDDAVSAVEYKRVGEIIEAKRKASKENQHLSKELAEVKETLKYLAEHNKAVEKAAYDKAVRDLYQVKLSKIAEGDVQAVQEIERQQASLVPPTEIKVLEVIPEVKQPEASTDLANNPDVVRFRDKYRDYLTGTSAADLAIQGYVQMRANKYQADNPNGDVTEAINSIEEGVRDLLQNMKNPNKSKPAATGSSTTSESNKGIPSVSRLSFEHRKVLAQLQEVDADYKTAKGIESFIKQLELTGKL